MGNNKPKVNVKRFHDQKLKQMIPQRFSRPKIETNETPVIEKKLEEKVNYV